VEAEEIDAEEQRILEEAQAALCAMTEKFCEEARSHAAGTWRNVGTGLPATVVSAALEMVLAPMPMGEERLSMKTAIYRFHDERCNDAISHTARAVQLLASVVGVDALGENTLARLRDVKANLQEAQRLVALLEEGKNHEQDDGRTLSVPPGNGIRNDLSRLGKGEESAVGGRCRQDRKGQREPNEDPSGCLQKCLSCGTHEEGRREIAPQEGAVLAESCKPDAKAKRPARGKGKSKKQPKKMPETPSRKAKTRKTPAEKPLAPAIEAPDPSGISNQEPGSAAGTGEPGQ